MNNRQENTTVNEGTVDQDFKLVIPTAVQQLMEMW